MGAAGRPVPPSVGVLLRGTPRAGTVEEINAVSQYLTNVRYDAVQYVTAARPAQEAIAGLESAAVERLHARLGRGLFPGVAALEDSADEAKSAVQSYAAQVAEIHREADQVWASAERALGSIAAAVQPIAQICDVIAAPFSYSWDTPPPASLPEPRLRAGAGPADAAGVAELISGLRDGYRTRWLNTVLEWQLELAEVRRCVRRWSELQEERLLCEGAVAERLGRTPVGELITVGAGMPGGRRRAIAVGLTGEIGGVRAGIQTTRTFHPELRELLDSADGAKIWDAPPAPAFVAEKWAGLDESVREELIRSVPWVIGNLPGLLPSVRDRANRELVEFYREYPQTLTPEQLTLVAEAQRILDDEARQRSPKPPIQVLAFDLSGPVPRAAIGYGDLDTSSHTTFQAAGMGSDAHTALPTWDVAARNLYEAQEALLPRFEGGGPGVVAWLGYDTPAMLPNSEVFRSESASLGAGRLAAELDGMAAAREAADAGLPAIGVVAHSYGTTMAAIALTKTKHPVDSFVMLGSAGLDTEAVPSLGSLNVRELTPGQLAVFATSAARDRLAPTGAAQAERGLPTPDARALLGLEQRVPVYGGVIAFSSEGDPARGLKGTDGHSFVGAGKTAGIAGMTASAGRGYGDARTQALDTTARATTGLIAGPDGLDLVVTEAQPVVKIVDKHTGYVGQWRMPAERND